MYDAQQGSDSGAHIDMSTKSGTNQIHGSLYGHRGTNWLNAAPFFFKKDDNIPAAYKNPQLHRYTAGGTFGGPIIKDKLFGFVSYQHLHISDQETGDELLVVPPGLSDTNRTPAGSTDIANNNWTTNEGYSANVQYPENPAATTVTSTTGRLTLSPSLFSNTNFPAAAPPIQTG